MRDISEMRAELSQIEGEEERLAWFEKLVQEFDNADQLNDRKHYRKNRRHPFDPHLLDQDCDEEIHIPSEFRTYNTSDYWLDYIYSRRPEDLPELVENEAVSKILKGLNFKRKEVLFYRLVHRHSAEEIAALKGVSDRNIRKLYEKAIQEIREQVEIDKQVVCN